MSRLRAMAAVLALTAATLAPVAAHASTGWWANRLVCDRWSGDQGYADGQIHNSTSRPHGYVLTMRWTWFQQLAGTKSVGVAVKPGRTVVWMTMTAGPLEVGGRPVQGHGGLGCIGPTVREVW